MEVSGSTAPGTGYCQGTRGGNLRAALPVGNFPARSERGFGKRSERACIQDDSRLGYKGKFLKEKGRC